MTENQPKKKFWIRGRKGICIDGTAITQSYNICPKIVAAIHEYCSKNKMLKSLLVNEAIRAYLAQNDKQEQNKHTV